MRTRIAIIAMLSALLISGCSYFGGGSKKTAAAPEASYDVLQEQRSQWQQLADQGNAEAEYQLGMSYCCGYGPGHTNAKAYHWLCRAALQGHEQAEYQLGRMFGNVIKKRPLSTPQTMDIAYMWYGLAAAQGSQLATGYMNALGQSMTAQQIARARDWQTHPADVVNCG
jgi:TPR repeat protein